MKKIKFYMLSYVTILFCLLFSSCSKENNSNSDSGNYIEYDGVKEELVKLEVGDNINNLQHPIDRTRASVTEDFVLIAASQQRLCCTLNNYISGESVNLSSSDDFRLSGYNELEINSNTQIAQGSILKVSNNNDVYTFDLFVSFKEGNRYHTLKAHYHGKMVYND